VTAFASPVDIATPENLVADQERTGPGHPLRRDAMIYGLGIVMRRAATLIMLPIYTRLLTPSDYGLLQMLYITLDVASILMSAGMTAGVMRFYFKATTECGRREVIVTAAVLVLSMNLIGGIALALGAGPIHQHVLGGAGTVPLVYIAAANFAVSEMLTVPMLLMQIEGRATLFSVTSLVRLVGQLTLNILFLIVLRLGPAGILASTLIANVAIGGCAMVWMLRRVGFRPSRAAVRDLRRFGVPYQLATAATFILQFGDRFFLEAHRGLAVVGVYGFAYQFGFLIDQLGAQPLMRAWQPRRFAQTLEPRAQREAADNAALHSLTLCVVSLGLGLALFARPGLKIIANPDYYPAANLVPLIVAAFVFQAWGDVVQFGIDASERTRYTTLVMWLSAALVLYLYAILIPPFGAYGAATATLVSFAARTAMLGYFSNRVWPLKYDWSRQFRVFGVGVALCGLDSLIPIDGLVPETVSATLLSIVYVLYVWNLELSDSMRVAIRTRIARLTSLGRRRMVPA
jgi:O-antigen/teichoic acid export membrane protein